MATLNVPCFRYLGNDISAPLTIEDGAGEAFVRCPVRMRLFRLTPEERVRQALVWFLHDGSNRAAAMTEHIRFAVEERSMDIRGYSVGGALDDNFRPNVTATVLETKRIEEEIRNHVEQLKKYLHRDQCRSGLLFSGRQAAWLQMEGNFTVPKWQIETLTDLSQVEQRIELAGKHTNTYLTNCRSLFRAAAGGDFSSLTTLVEFFETDRNLTFSLSIRTRGSLGLVQACSMSTNGPNLITYRARGVASKNRQHLTMETFHSLVSVRPGCS